ncbi:hypothetical protein ABT124_51445 [Streptomyces sp. NPDC001982]|uniref:hypothetical protein n=1 Tax=Streptomyces sp. NPDC001982 TaxID=3154405 RepID=UPI003324D7B6
MSRRFEGKVALVAGGGRTPPEAGGGIGVGAATSMLLAREGCRAAVQRGIAAARRQAVGAHP